MKDPKKKHIQQSDAMSHDFDLITIGAGSGGVAASRYAAKAYGAKVAICEQGRIGGTCVLRGCIPKKILMYAAQFSDAFADARGYGWDEAAPALDLNRLIDAKDAETSRLERIYEQLLSESGVVLIRGSAHFIDPHTVQVGSQRLTADRILLATGGAPSSPPIPGIGLAITSNEALDMRQLPGELLVLGSGYVAIEFASIFRGLGSNVTLAYRSDMPLRGFDPDIRSRLAKTLVGRGIQLRPEFEPMKIERVENRLRVEGRRGHIQYADVVLNAMGRSPQSSGLRLEEAGVKTGSRGEILVDGRSRTNVSNVYAIGDVTDRVALTPIAIAEGRAFVDDVFGRKPRMIDHSLVASAVFANPPIASIGLSEDRARTMGLDVSVFEADFRPMKNVIAQRNERAYMKLVVDRCDGRVLGAHMLGPDAPEIIQGLSVAITMGITKAQLDATLALHPTAAEEFVLMRTPRAAHVGEALAVQA